MAYPVQHRFRSRRVLRLVLVVVCVCFVGYITGPPFFPRKNPKARASCPSCVCDCSLEIAVSFSSDCKHDPDIYEEIEQDNVDLLSEELTLHSMVTNDAFEHTRASIMNAKKTSSHYQSEAQKCNTGMGTCEEARERAEAELVEERKLSAEWENRARKLGWKDDRRVHT